MYLLTFLALAFLLISIFGGLSLHMYLYKRGDLPSIQRRDKVVKHNEGDAIREEIKSDVTVVARFQDMFGSHIVIQTERGHPVWVTVFVATPDEETRYRVYTNSFTKEEWHPEALVASDFKASMQDYVPQPVENRLNKMMQDEMQARERRRRIFV